MTLRRCLWTLCIACMRWMCSLFAKEASRKKRKKNLASTLVLPPLFSHSSILTHSSLHPSLTHPSQLRSLVSNGPQDSTGQRQATKAAYGRRPRSFGGHPRTSKRASAPHYEHPRHQFGLEGSQGHDAGAGSPSRRGTRDTQSRPDRSSSQADYNDTGINTGGS